jgi:hypothetical protein
LEEKIPTVPFFRFPEKFACWLTFCTAVMIIAASVRGRDGKPALLQQHDLSHPRLSKTRAMIGHQEM